MERHRCKLCSKIFSNGRALGGHMRSHLATLPLPSKKNTDQPQLGDPAHSDSSSTQSHEDDLSGYGLRANPKRSFKGSDPGLFLDAGSAVQEQEQEQDRESETESTHNATARRRSKRAIHKEEQQTQDDHEIEYSDSKKKSKHSESVTESAPVSSVSDASQDEEVALCLMMLSRDNRVWVRRETREEKSVQDTNDSAALTTRGARKICKTNRALLGHGGHKDRESSKDYQAKQNNNNNNNNGGEKKIYECPFCGKVFGSGQALGGHKRSHLLASTTTNKNKAGDDHSKSSFSLDLNLPAPIDDDRDDQDHSQLDFF